MMSELRSEQIGLRVSPSDKAAMVARANAAGLTLTEFVVRCALGTVEPAPDRVAELERRVAAVEALLIPAG